MKINRILYRFSGKYRLEIDKQISEKREMERKFWEEFLRDAKSASVPVYVHDHL